MDELTVLSECIDWLERALPEARGRIIDYLIDRFDLNEPFEGEPLDEPFDQDNETDDWSL
jgi:hypothetical protein